MEDANRFVTTFQRNSLVDVIGAFAWQPVMKADAKVRKKWKDLKVTMSNVKSLSPWKDLLGNELINWLERLWPPDVSSTTSKHKMAGDRITGNENLLIENKSKFLDHAFDFCWLKLLLEFSFATLLNNMFVLCHVRNFFELFMLYSVSREIFFFINFVKPQKERKEGVQLNIHLVNASPAPMRNA